MTRFAIMSLLAIWSASVAAQPAWPMVESDQQRLEFSRTMADGHGSQFGPYTSSWRSPPVTVGARKHQLATFGWYSYPTPRVHEDARYREDLQVFDRLLSPGVSLNLSGSSLSLYRKGLRYEVDSSPWFIDVNFRNSNRGSKLLIRDEPAGAKGKALIIEFGVSF